MISGARQGTPSGLRRLFAAAMARDLYAFVVPGIEVARAFGLDIEAAGLRITGIPRHASVLLIVGEPPEELRKAAAVVYAQMMRPRAVLAVGAGELSPLTEADVSVGLSQEALDEGVTRLRSAFVRGVFDPAAEDFEPVILRTRTEYTCPMHPEVVQDEPGTCPECGMELVPREAQQEHEGHDHGDESCSGHGERHDHEMGHGAEDGRDGEPEHGGEHGSHEEMDHGGHEHMDHGDMGFMSMVEMTKDLPRSSDGLPMEWVEAPFGPLFPGLPGGLSLTLTLDGDTVAEAQAESVIKRWVSPERPTGLAGSLDDLLSGLDPLSPVAYRVLELKAIESAAGVEPGEREARARAGALERERAASHLGWLSGFAHLIGYRWLSRRAAELQLSVLRADAVEIAGQQAEARKLSRRVERTPLLRRRLSGIGLLPDGEDVSGPVARANGIETDARSDDETYRALGFEPIVREGGDALARLRVRLAEIENSLDVASAAGSLEVSTLATCDGVSGTGAALVETPRGPATLRATLEHGEVVAVELDTPSTRHLALIHHVAEQRELADALVGVASLDLSPWEAAR